MCPYNRSKRKYYQQQILIYEVLFMCLSMHVTSFFQHNPYSDSGFLRKTYFIKYIIHTLIHLTQTPASPLHKLLLRFYIDTLTDSALCNSPAQQLICKHTLCAPALPQKSIKPTGSHWRDTAVIDPISEELPWNCHGVHLILNPVSQKYLGNIYTDNHCQLAQKTLLIQLHQGPTKTP